MPAVIAAVHHAQDTLTQLADADHHQLRTASMNGRLLLPAPALPDFFDTPYIYGPAPAASAEPLLTAYHDARTASARATARTAIIAEALQAPSRTLTAAPAATQPASADPSAPRRHAPEPAERPPPPGHPGLVERILHDLKITAPDKLQRAAAIDHAAEQLILETACEPDHDRPATTPRDLTRSAGIAEIISHMLASGDPRALALLHPPEPAQPAQAEIEH